MESNISRDHIAMEAMRALLEKTVYTKKGRFGNEDELILPEPFEVANVAYEYADAMIAVRNYKEAE